MNLSMLEDVIKNNIGTITDRLIQESKIVENILKQKKDAAGERRENNKWKQLSYINNYIKYLIYK